MIFNLAHVRLAPLECLIERFDRMWRPVDSWGYIMRKLGILFAGLYVVAMLGGISSAQAHSTKACQQEIKAAGTLCKLSPTAWLTGMCKNKKVLQWCSDKKQHKKKFHEN